MKRLLLIALIACPFAFFQMSAGCAGQAEGQLCSPLNLDADCADGLVCTTPGMGSSGTNGVCCQANSTHPACIALGTTTTTTITTTTTTTTTTSTTTSGTGGTGTGGGATGGAGTGGGATGGAGTGGN